ncbi:MAG: hypothetical protein FJ152_07560 [Firmicutes bacterium]|nr:hypothetical protein [Bacillota bacterium]
MQILATVIAVLYILCFRNAAIGLVATCLNDQSAKRSGQITLNPLQSLNIIGLIFVFRSDFGWTKPVNVYPHAYNKKWKESLVYLSGFAFHLISMIIFSLLLKVSAGNLHVLLNQLLVLNAGFVVFNLFPVANTDLFRIVKCYLPKSKTVKFLSESGATILGMIVLLSVVLSRIGIEYQIFTVIGIIRNTIINTI